MFIEKHTIFLTAAPALKGKKPELNQTQTDPNQTKVYVYLKYLVQNFIRFGLVGFKSNQNKKKTTYF